MHMLFIVNSSFLDQNGQLRFELLHFSFPGDKLQTGQSGLARVINDLLTAPLKAKTVKQKKYICSQLYVLSPHILSYLAKTRTFGPELFSQSQQSQAPFYNVWSLCPSPQSQENSPASSTCTFSP